MATPNAVLPAAKQMVLGLYVTAREAYDQWKAAPETVKRIEARTPEEFIWVGRRRWSGRFPSTP